MTETQTRLIFVDRDDDVHLLTEEITTLGRADGNTIQIAWDETTLTVSKQHARLVWKQRKLLLEDVGSSGGTYIIREGVARRISNNTQVPLSEGSIIRLGREITARIVGLPESDRANQPTMGLGDLQTHAEHAEQEEQAEELPPKQVNPDLKSHDNLIYDHDKDGLR